MILAKKKIQSKVKSVARLEKNLWDAFSEYVRLRDSDENGYCRCFTCGAVRYYKALDCGHGIPRQHKATKYNLQNNHAQCKPCNGFEGGKREEYKAEMNKRYGQGTWERMDLISRQPYKLSRFEIETMTLYYKSAANDLKSMKNLKT